MQFIATAAAILLPGRNAAMVSATSPDLDIPITPIVLSFIERVYDFLGLIIHRNY